MASHRIAQVNALIQSEVGAIIQREVALRPGVMVTIAKVDTSKDLRYARISVSVFPASASAYVDATLRNECGEIQRILYKRLSMHPLPRLIFLLDDTEERADRVEKILRDL